MAITYAATGIAQNNSTVAGNTSSANSTYSTTTLQTTVAFAALSGVVAGMRLTAPAALLGAEVITASATSISVYPGNPTAIPSGTTFTFVDSDGVLAAGAGLTLNTTGAAPNASRQVVLTGTGSQFTINGTYVINALQNQYSCVGSSTQAGFIINGTLNIVGSANNTNTGLALSGGQVCIVPNTQSAASETITTTIVQRGTLNITGAGYYGNSPWVLDTAGGTSGAAGSVTTLTNAFIRLGTATTGALNTIYADAYRGTTLTSRFTFNIINSTLVDVYCKFLAVRTNSTITGARWFKTIPNSVTLSTNLDIAIAISPTIATDTVGFNFIGPTFGLTGQPNSYYNTHIAIGNTSSNTGAPTAVRSTVYGYETGIVPRIGKVIDFPSIRPWIEGRKVLQLTLRNNDGTILTAAQAGTYLEDIIQNTGGLATVFMAGNTAGTGYTNGTFNSNAGVITGGGTGGVVQITIAGGAVTDARITTPGSGYNATNGVPINLVVNSTNFTGVGASTNASLNIFPFRRYGAFGTSNVPDFTGNRIYIADTTAAGIVNVTQTNSGTSGVALSANNPTPPNGTAYTGIDFLIWAANCAYPNLNNPAIVGQALVPIDQRWSVDGSTAYSIAIPIRGYLYLDNSFTLTEAAGGGATDIAAGQLFLTNDTYAVATGITETTAGTFTDVTLVAAAPTRNATTNAFIPTTTGTLTCSAARSLDQVYAKSKFDYTRRALNTTAGTVARTGFGLAFFLSNVGTLTNATMGIGVWSATLTAKIASGSVFKTLSSTSIINLGAQATSVGDNGISVAANTIFLGTQGTPATWTTTYSPLAVSGNGTVTLSGLGALVPGGTVTTASIATTVTPTANNTTIAAALQAVLPANSTVTAATTGTPAVITFTNASGLAVAGGVRTWTLSFTQSVGSKLPASIVYTAAATTSSSAEELSGLRGAAVANTTITGNWTVSAVASNAFTLTELIPSSTTYGATISSSGGTTASGNDGTTSVVQGNVGTLVLNFSVVASTTAVTPVPSLSSTIIGLITTQSNASIVPSTATTLGTTIYQNLAATSAISGLPTSGLVASNCSLTLGTSTAITLTDNISFTSVNFVSGSIALTPDTTGRTLSLTDCGNLTTFPFTNTTPATVINVVPVGSTVLGTLPAGFQIIVNFTVTLPNTGNVPTTSVRVNKLYQNPTTAAATTIITPTLTASASGIIVSWAGNAADRFAYCGFVDGLIPVTFNKPAGSSANPVPQGGVVIDPNNLDFTQRANFVASDNTFISGTTWLIGSGVSFQSPAAVYDRTPSRPISKMVVRALMENGNANALHFGIATEVASSNVLLRDFLIFTQTGTQTNTAWSVTWSKATTNNLVALNLWNVDQTGIARNISTTDVTTQIQFFGFSPGAVAELTGADLALIGIVSAEANLPAFNTISSRVNQSSLLIPSTTTPIT